MGTHRKLILDDKQYRLVPEEEYDTYLAISEDAADLSVLSSRQTEETVPAAFVERMLEGEHPAKLWREHRGLRCTEAARKAELASSYLSDIENGKKPGSVKAYKKLAELYGVDVDDLLPE